MTSKIGGHQRRRKALLDKGGLLSLKIEFDKENKSLRNPLKLVCYGNLPC